MVRVDLYSGLLGAGKTTLIRKMLETTYQGQQVVIIENEIGRVNFDSALLGNDELRIEQITGGCICCSVAGDIRRSIIKINKEIHPDVIVIEPTGASDLSALIHVIEEVEEVQIGLSIMVLKAHKCHTLLSIIGDFYYDQIRCADVLFLNQIEKLKNGMLDALIGELRAINPDAEIVAVPLSQIDENTFDNRPIVRKQTSILAQDHSLRVVEEKEEENSQIKMRSVGRKTTAGHKTIYTWEYTFQRPLQEAQVRKLSEWLMGKHAEGIWRVKGILTMTDGSHRKYDVSFGEVSVEDLAPDVQVPLNTLVFIGPKIPKARLKSYLESMAW